MIKSDSNYYNTSTSSSGSDCLSENSKSLDTVTQLFSNLLKNSDSSTNLRSKSPSLASHSNLNNDLSQPIKQEYNTEENIRTNSLPEQLKESSDGLNTNRIQTDQRATSTRRASNFIESNDAVIFDKSKDFYTPFNSKIPVLHVKSDPTDFYESEKKTPTSLTGRKPLNPETLKRISSTSKIPVRNIKKNYTQICSQNKSPVDFFKSRSTRQVDRQKQINIKSDKSCNGKYNHVKSKLAAYIHRPSKIDTKYVYSSSNIKNTSKSPLENKKVREDYGFSQNTNSSNSYHIRRVESRTSLDTYTCDYKMPFTDLNCVNCPKSDDSCKHYQKAREHLEQAAEHYRIKLENCRIIEEHKRIIDKHHRVVLEHEEKASEHELKAIAFILNRIT